jgi:hypothetical protein
MRKGSGMEMDNLWERIKKSVAEGAAYAAEKTEELTKLGKAKIEILNIKHKISKSFTELGGVAYDSLKKGNAAALGSSPEIDAIVNSLINLERELDEKEKAFETMKQKN